MQINGQVRAQTRPRRSVVATGRVRLLDVSRLDAPATLVNEVDLGEVVVSADSGLVIPFTLDVEDALLDPRREYILAAHVDLTGSGTVTPGDYVTTTALPAPAPGSASQVVIPVHEVT